MNRFCLQSARSKAALALSLGVVLGLSVSYLSGPIFAVAKLKSALIANEPSQWEEVADFDAVRMGLGEQIQDSITRRLSSGAVEDARELTVAAALIEIALDRLFTPEVLSQMVAEQAGATAAEREQFLRRLDSDPLTGGLYARWVSPSDYELGSESVDGMGIRIVLRRQGLMRWRVRSVELPFDRVLAYASS